MKYLCYLISFFLVTVSELSNDFSYTMNKVFFTLSKRIKTPFYSFLVLKYSAHINRHMETGQFDVTVSDMSDPRAQV